MGISGTANPHRAFPVSDCAGQRFAHSPYGYPFRLANGLGPTTQPPNAITESTSLECNPLRSGAAFATDLPAWTKRGGLDAAAGFAVRFPGALSPAADRPRCGRAQGLADRDGRR